MQRPYVYFEGVGYNSRHPDPGRVLRRSQTVASGSLPEDPDGSGDEFQSIEKHQELTVSGDFRPSQHSKWLKNITKYNVYWDLGLIQILKSLKKRKQLFLGKWPKK